MFESLEHRQLLAGYTANPIVIEGTAGNDNIAITQSGNQLTVVNNGTTKVYSLSYTTGGSSPANPGPTYHVPKIIVNGRAGNDTIKADTSVQKPMEIKGGAGDDSIRGGARNDTIWGGSNLMSGLDEAGKDTIDGSDGDDALYASRNNGNALYGWNGNDTLTGYNGIDTFHGGAGNDSITGGNGNDWLHGDTGNDTLTGNDGTNVYVAGDGHDSVVGGINNETLWGGTGNDTLLGNGGPDQLNGGGDHDLLIGGFGGGDQYSGGTGNDTASFEAYSDALKITLDDLANDGAANENDNVRSDVETIIGGSGKDKITGSLFANRIIGNGGADLLRGGGGGDTILGGWGADTIHGDAGNDQMFGEFSSDKIYGGAGDDLLDGGTDDDVLVAIGGGTKDVLVSGAGYRDSMWLDTEGTETHDATADEVANRCVHRVGAFSNGASKEATGQDIFDPVVDDNDTEHYVAGQTQFNDNPLFAQGGAHDYEVKQGSLGDCWFLATLASIADQKSNVIHQSITELGDGSYAVMFYEDGARRYYRVDNDLPVLKDGGNLAYAKTGWDGAMWVPIMEKAYAIHEGDSDYDGIAGGWAEDAFDDLGISNQEIDVDDDNAMQTIKNHLAAGRAVTVSSVWGNFDVGDNYVASHVYSVVSVNDNGTITLRNPWGTDAGSGSGAWVQGDNDGYVTFSQSSIISESEDFTVGWL